MSYNIRKSDFVSYYDAGYRGRYISEDGEQEIWDWHEYSSGKVLQIHENSALVLFYSGINDSPQYLHTIVVSEIFVAWVNVKYLNNSTEQKPMEIIY